MKDIPLDAALRELDGLKADHNLNNRDFLLTWEHTPAELRSILLTARILRALHDAGRSVRAFDTGLAVSIFRDQSTRTRFSFASAASALGLTVSDLDETKSQIAHGETVRETAVMISFLAEAIGIRDDIFLGEGNRYMREVAAALQEAYEQGVLARRPAVINLQCDIDHPTQTLADLAHLERRFCGLDALRGRKFVISWAYSPSYGKPLSVPQGLIGLFPRFGIDVTLAYPEGYDLLPEVVALAGKQAAAAGATTLAVRVPAYPLLRELLAEVGPLTATSANASGAPACTRPDDVARALGHGLALLLDGGETPGGAATTLLDLTAEPPRVLRSGAWRPPESWGVKAV